MNDHPENAPVERAAAALRSHFGEPPGLAIVLGSGLGKVIEDLEQPHAVPSTQLGFPQSTVVGHAGRVVVGGLAGSRIAAISGRVHLYEGLAGAQVVRSVRALHAWGVRRLLLTASVGGIREGLEPGELLLVTDHLNLQGVNPLFGPAFGERFPDLTCAYDRTMREALVGAAHGAGLTLHQGVYAAMPGPSYETPAEVRMLRMLGADVVGMSTVPEVIAANAIGLPVAALAIVSNRAAGLSGQALSHSEVTENADQVAQRVAALLAGFSKRLS